MGCDRASQTKYPFLADDDQSRAANPSVIAEVSVGSYDVLVEASIRSRDADGTPGVGIVMSTPEGWMHTGGKQCQCNLTLRTSLCKRCV